MKTKEDYVSECRLENPQIVENTNGIERSLDPKECDEAIEAWALMRWYQDNPDEIPFTQ